MEISTALWIALALWVGLFVPTRSGTSVAGGRTDTLVHWWKPRGHSDIGPDVPVGNVPGERVFRQTRPGADDAKGARY